MDAKEVEADKDADKKLAERRRANKIVRVARRKKTRAQAKANGHKLGSRNRVCKRCGLLPKSEEFTTQCLGEAPIGR